METKELTREEIKDIRNRSKELKTFIKSMKEDIEVFGGTAQDYLKLRERNSELLGLQARLLKK